MEHKMKEIIQKTYFDALKNIPESMQTKHIVIDYKLAVIGCILKQFPNLGATILSKILNNDVSDSTISRFRKKRLRNHKHIWNLIENTNFCTTFDFDTFMSYKIEDFSPATIVKRKPYYDYYKKLYAKGMIKEEFVNKMKEFRNIENSRKRSERNKKEIEKQNVFNSLVNTFKNKNRKIKKVHILATTRSNEEIKKLAKSFNCEIAEVTNKIDVHDFID
jgi:hypothetical protein